MAAAGLAASQLATAARAADQYFDSDGVGPATAGPALWDSSSNRWSDTPGGATYTPWVNFNTANFNGPGGTIMFDSFLQPSGITLSAGNWNFARNPINSGATLDLAGAPTILNIAAGGKAEMLNVVTGGGAILLTGGGLVNVYTGFATSSPSVTVQNGTLRYASGAGDLGANTALALGSQGVLDMSIINDTFGSLEGAAGSVVKLGTLNLGIATGSLISVGGNSANTEVAGSIRGAGGRVNKQGAGTMILSGANTYTGYTRVQGGTLIARGGAALADVAPVIIDNVAGATLQIEGNEAIGVIVGGGATGGLFNAGPGNVTIGGDNFSGNYDGDITGSGTIRKVGSGTQIFNGTGGAGLTSTFTGKYVLEGGTLAIRSDARLGPNPAAATDDYITLAGGDLSNTGFGGTTLGNNKGITVSKDSSITVFGSTASTLTIGASGGGARISGTNTITKRGPGVLAINTDSAASYTGTWRIIDGTLSTSRGIASPFGTGSFDIEGGTLLLRPAANSGDVAYQLARAATDSGLYYGPGAILSVDRNNNNGLSATFGSPGAASSSLVRKDRGTLLITAANGVANLGNATAAGERIFFNGGVNLVNGIIPGAVGTTSITGAGTADASLSVGNFLSYDATSGVIAATYTSNDLATSTAASITEQLTDVTLAGNAATGALKVGNGVNRVFVNAGANTISVGNGSAPGMVILNGSDINGGTLDFGGGHGVIYTQLGQSSVSAAIKGSGGFAKTGPGSLTLNAPATYTGNTDLSQGTLILTANNQLPTTSHFRINGNATLDLSANGGVSQEFASFGSENFTPSSGSGGAVLILGDASVLKFGAGTTDYRGDIVSPSPAGEGNATLWKAGPGKLTLGVPQAISSHAGGTAPPAINYDQLWVTDGGVVELSSANSVPDQPTAARGISRDTYHLDNGTIRVSSLNTAGITSASTFTLGGARRGLTVGPGGGTIDVANPQEIVFFQADNGETIVSDLITGSGTMTKIGPGYLRLGYGNSFTGRWVIKEGNLQYQQGGSLGVAPASFVPNQLEVDGGIIQSNGSGIHEPTRGILIGPNNATFNSGPFILNGVVSGPGTITRIGGGTQASGVSFNANNNTFGGLIVRQGFVSFNGNNSAGNGTITMDPAAYVAFGKNEGPDNSINNTIVLGSGSVIDIRVTSDTSPVVGSIYKDTPTGTLTLAGKITGPGTLFKGYAQSERYFTPPQFTATVERNLDGTVIFANNTNDFTGDLTVMYGTVVAAANNALGATAGSTAVFDGGALTFAAINYTAPERVYIAGLGVPGKPDVGSLGAQSGASTFAGPVQIMKDATVGANAGASLNLAGPVTGNAQLSKVGPGRVILSNANNVLPGTTVVSQGTLEFAANHSIGKLQLIAATTAAVGGGDKVLKVQELAWDSYTSPDAKIDLGAGRFALDYPEGGPSPLQDVRSAILFAKAGNWDANGITSSLLTQPANSNKGIGYGEASAVFGESGGNFGGVNVDGTTVLARYTLLGDASLDGTVDFTDLVKLAQNYNDLSGNRVWTEGDYTYDGIVDFNDLVLLAQNYNTSLPTAAQLAAAGVGASFAEDLSRAFAQVPEPGTLSALALGAATMLTRRRRRE
jgi:autotransporter-associated beta strand protein